MDGRSRDADDQGIDRGRRAGRHDARPGSRLARHRCRRRREAAGRRAAERQVRPDFGPLHGSLSPPRRRPQAARRRAAGGLSRTTSSRRRACSASSFHACRFRRAASAAPRPTGPDTSWPTPEHTHRVNQIFFEPVLFAHVAAQPRVRILNRTEVDGVHPARAGRHGDGARPRQRTSGSRSTARISSAATAPARWCARRSAPSSGHAGAAARALDLHTRAGAEKPASRETGLALLFAQPPPLRRDDGGRRPRDLERPEFFLSRRAGPHCRGSRLGDPQILGVGPDFQYRGARRRRTGSPAASSRTSFGTGASSSAATRRICGFRSAATG